jgi:hypothetical protein
VTIENDNTSVITENSTKPMVGDHQKEVSPAPETEVQPKASPPAPAVIKKEAEEGAKVAPKIDAEAFLNGNRRHGKEFNKHKSSEAMKTLLKTDEQEEKKRQLAAQLASKVDFENKKNHVVAGPSILNKTSARREDSGSRSLSRGRPGSRWRKGVTRESLERQAQESARKQVELQRQSMQYPEWWQGHPEIQDEREDQEAKQEPHRSNPVKAKVHKNMRRYAEDSLDARLRQAQQNSNQEAREQASPSMQDSRAY